MEELVLIFYNSIQDYFDYTKSFNSLCPTHYNFRNATASPSLYYSTEFDDDYDDDDFYEFAETIQNDRAKFFQLIMIFRKANGVFDKFYVI